MSPSNSRHVTPAPPQKQPQQPQQPQQPPPPPHTNILHQAKQTQQQDLKQSATYIKQLHSITSRLISSNSNADPLTTKSNLLDKITTIHELNKNIDHQLNDEISYNYYHMMKAKRKVEKLSQGCVQKLEAMNQVVHVNHDDWGVVGVDDKNLDENNTPLHGQSSNVAELATRNRKSRLPSGEINKRNNVAKLSLQRRCELIDQDLRILEHTLKLINERN
ncbi:hypothetical protein KGF57_002023 [Candida theae]|uniref:Uncharacterized protein n=1 Tax=Candida theae TaxID=1198502 RepID=A0AAD5FZ48_9ASCO|nr:uncharacterized protein KGF57_002023 [Candida theae]KAI5959686.1 hypothetical protein KGF57_002023 [Candida theae]